MATSSLLRCPACGATNRVATAEAAAGRQPVCGRCRARLPQQVSPVKVTDATFAAEVEQSPVPVVVDLWAAWCGPCRTLEPIIEELASAMAGRVRFAKLNVDENPATASRFNVRSIPTLLVFRGGREIDRIVGVHPKAALARRLEALTA